MLQLLDLCRPAVLHLDSLSNTSILLARVQTARLVSFEISTFEAEDDELDTLSQFLRRAFATLQSLRLPNWFPLEHTLEYAAFNEEGLPTCPDLKVLSSEWFGGLESWSEDKVRSYCDINYYLALIKRHDGTLEELGLGPLQYKHSKTLSRIGHLPKLKTVVLEDFILTSNKPIESTFEFRLLQDLGVFSSITHIRILPRGIGSAPEQAVAELHLAAILCYRILLSRKDWLPQLATLTFDGVKTASWETTKFIEDVSWYAYRPACLAYYRELKDIAQKRGVRLLGAFSEALDRKCEMQTAIWDSQEVVCCRILQNRAYHASKRRKRHTNLDPSRHCSV